MEDRFEKSGRDDEQRNNLLTKPEGGNFFKICLVGDTMRMNKIKENSELRDILSYLLMTLDYDPLTLIQNFSTKKDGIEIMILC